MPSTIPQVGNIKIPPPFPQKLVKKNQDSHFKKFFEILKQLHINITLIDALE